MEQDTTPGKPVNWYSGWRLLATAAVTVLAAKLIGILGTAVALLLFFWLQPKRGTWQALAAGTVGGVAAALIYSTVVVPQIPEQRERPAAQEGKSFTYEEAYGLPPAQR